jgi:hypothetical protein
MYKLTFNPISLNMYEVKFQEHHLGVINWHKGVQSLCFFPHGNYALNHEIMEQITEFIKPQKAEKDETEGTDISRGN